MKNLNTTVKISAQLLALLVFMTSCTTYYKTSVTLEEAVLSSEKAKVESSAYGTFSFDKIEKTEDKYYGIKASKEEEEKLELNENKINAIYLKNKTKSTILTILIPIALGAVVLGFFGVQNKKEQPTSFF